MSAPLHACPGGCGTQVHARRLACEVCWKRLPKWLRDAVNVAWGRWRCSPEDGRAVAAHRAAVARAVQWYRDNPGGYR